MAGEAWGTVPGSVLHLPWEHMLSKEFLEESWGWVHWVPVHIYYFGLCDPGGWIMESMSSSFPLVRRGRHPKDESGGSLLLRGTAQTCHGDNVA